jgi:TldD protein
LDIDSVGWVIDHDILQRVLTTAMRSGGDFAEVYAEDKRSTSAGLDDGRVEQVNTGRDRGAGVRVLAGETAGYAYTSDLTVGGLTAAAEAAAAAARNGKGAVAAPLEPAGWHRVNAVEVDPGGVPKSTKVDLLRRIDEAARSSGKSVVQVSASYADSRKDVLVANTDGVLTNDAITRCMARISVVADGDTGMQTGFQSVGHTVGFETFDRVDVEALARDAARMATTKLEARPAP